MEKTGQERFLEAIKEVGLTVREYSGDRYKVYGGPITIWVNGRKYKFNDFKFLDEGKKVELLDLDQRFLFESISKLGVEKIVRI